jgi:hypothetical protein
MMNRGQQTKRKYSCLVFLLACNHHYYLWRPQQQHHVARAFGATAVNRRSAACKATTFENAERRRRRAPFRLENSKEAVAEVTEGETASGKRNNDEDDESLTFWSQLSDRITQCLLESDRKRDDGFDGASTGWTSWVEEKSARALQECFDRMTLRSVGLETGGMDDEGFSSWLRWIKASPSPVTIELSDRLRNAVLNSLANGAADDAMLQGDDDNLEEFIQRIGCRLYVLPSGATLPSNLRAPPGGMIYGKLLVGGVTRFRLLGNSHSSRRRTGERTLILPYTQDGEAPVVPGWMQYGGPERNYDALDIGSCALLEIILLPKGLAMPLLVDDGGCSATPPHDMIITSFPWTPEDFLVRGKAEEELIQARQEEGPSKRDVSNDNDGLQVWDLETSFCTVGGLQPQIEQIVRRVLDGRVVRSVSELEAEAAIANNNDGDTTTERSSSGAARELDQVRRQEMQDLLELNLQPVRGLLLHGPPGCGK